MEVAPLSYSLVLHEMRGSARKAAIVLVPTGNPPSLRFGHPDVTSDDTAFPRWGTVRVRPRFPDAPSGCQPGRSPMRSEEEAERPGDGCPCVGAEEICGAPPLLSEGMDEDERRPSSRATYTNEERSVRIT